MRSVSRWSATAPLLVGCLALAGCAAPAPAAPTETPSAQRTMTVDNCGTTVSFHSAPQRVVTIKSTSLEMLLALGLGDRVVGAAAEDGPVPEKWADEAADIPSLSDGVPSEEAVLETRPDFVYAGWESNFSTEGAGERSALQDLGIQTFVSPSACREAKYQPGKLSFDDIFAEITQMAKIFQVDPSALLTKQQKILENIPSIDEDVTALWYSSGSKIPYIGGGIGAPQLIMETIGLTNVAADIDKTWSSLSWEAIVAKNPDVIILVDSTWNTKEHKISLLEGNPATRELTAVKDHRYLVIPFAASEAGVRTAAATRDLAQQLATLRAGD